MTTRIVPGDREERRSGVPGDREERRSGVPGDREERRSGVPGDREERRSGVPGDQGRRVKSIHVEPDVLAAWSEGTLPSSDARQVESHLADCATCQEMLAVFVRTEPPPAASSGLGAVLSGFSSVVSRFLTAVASAKAVSRTRWQWAVPMAAAGTVAAIWVAIPEEERTAQLNPTAAPTISAPAAPPADAVSVDAAAPTRAKQRAARGDVPAGSLADQAAPEARAENANQEKAEQFATSRTLETKERDQDLKAEAAPPAPAVAGAQASARAPAAPQPAQEQNRARAEGEAASLLRQAAPAEIVSPDPQIRWRIVPTGRLERSTNAGRTWEAVTFPQPVTATAVLAPSATTAIVTAADGRQFRTDDQGKTWSLGTP